MAGLFMTLGKNRIQSERSRLEVLGGRLAALDPMAVLSRGYALVLDDQAGPVSSVQGLTVGQSVALAFGDGKARASITEISQAEGKPDKPSRP